MLALDTNVLVRHFSNDVPAQKEAANMLLAGLTPESPGFIGREVVLEVVWVLERSYKFSRTRIANALLNLMAGKGILVENSEDVMNSLRQYSHSNADFSDLLILAAAKRAGANPLYTFDQRLARMDGAALLSVPQPG